MKKIIHLVAFFLISINAYTQSPVTVSMVTNCFDPAVTIPFFGNFNGKPAYDVNGGNFGGAPSQVSILWVPAASEWRLLLGGGTPIYTNSNDTPLPPATGWIAHPTINTLGTTCTTAITPPTLSGGVSVLLPVSMISFLAKSRGQKVDLEWTTAAEFNNDYFNIERSTDGRTFQKVGLVQGVGTTDKLQQYRLVDENPQTGINYYRLRQVDFDGTEEIYNVVSIMVDKGDESISVFPNPGNDRIELRLNKATQKDTPVKLFDINGRLVYESSIEAGHIQLAMDVSALAKGMYVLQLQNGQDVESHRFVKN